MPLIRAMARTAVVAGTATAVSGQPAEPTVTPRRDASAHRLDSSVDFPMPASPLTTRTPPRVASRSRSEPRSKRYQSRPSVRAAATEATIVSL